jgi:PAS domain S-box-containing protein
MSAKGGDGYLVHVLDITDRMHAEIQLKESEEKFRFLHINSPDMTMLQNSDGEISYISPQIKNVLGYVEAEFLGKSFPEQIHCDDRDKAYYMMTRVLGGEEINGLEYRFVGKDKQMRWLSHTARPIIVDGKVVRIQSSVRNITKQKESEIELSRYRIQMEDLVKERTKELEVKNEELENFSSLFVGREFRIKELRDQLELLEKKLKPLIIINTQ